jgi:hypothetical protein
LKARCLEGLGRLTGACSAVVVNNPGFRNGPSGVKPLE